MRTLPASPAGPVADKAALARLGERVRRRLADDAAVYRIAAEGVELFAVADFLAARECEYLIAMIERVAAPSKLFDPDNPLRYRTSYSGDVDAGDSFVRMIERRLADLLGLDSAHGECIQGQRYLPGQEFQAHFDWFDTAASYWPKEAKGGGQRSWTAMAYLNTVDEGGETDFPDLGLSIPPQRGALLLWNNARADGTPNPLTRHAGKPVLQGAKYIVTKWFRTRAWR